MKTTRRDFLTMAAAAVASLVIPKAARAETDAYQAQRGGLHITIKAMDNLSGAMQDAAHAFGDLGRELYLNDVRQAFVRGSRLIADNIGATLPEWSWRDAGQATGRKLLVAFNEYYAETHNISEAEACAIVEEIGDAWGLSNGPRELRVTVGNTMARYDLDWSIPHETVQARIDELSALRDVAAACQRGRLMTLWDMGVSVTGDPLRGTYELPPLCDPNRELVIRPAVGRMYLQTFDNWTVEHKVAPEDAAPYREEIAAEYRIEL